MAAITPDPWTVQHLQADGHVIRIEGYEIVTLEYDVVGGNPGVAPIRNKADAYLIGQSRVMYNLLKAMWPPVASGVDSDVCSWCGAMAERQQDINHVEHCPWTKSRQILAAVDQGQSD